MKCTTTLPSLTVRCLTVLQAPLLADREMAETLFKRSQPTHLFHKEVNCSLEGSFSPLGAERILTASFSWSQRLIVPLNLEALGAVCMWLLLSVLSRHSEPWQLRTWC